MAKGRAGRTYTRDSNGRFASSGSTSRQRPASRPAPRGRNRLTRDNSGRITGTGDGATARGGRLRTGAGNLRATQTARLKGQGGKVRRPIGGGGAKAAKAGGGASVVVAKPVRVRGNFRPQGVMAKPRKGENPFVSGSTTTKDDASRLANVKIAKGYVEKRGGKVSVYSGPKHIPARYNETKGVVEINRAATHWQNPKSSTGAERKTRFWSSSSPVGPLLHELGHRKSKGVGASWTTGSKSGSFEDRIRKASKLQQLAGRVSKYAQTNPAEFIAEAYAGRRTGRRYDSRVMRAYREAMGLPGIRTGSRVPPGGAALASPRAVARDRARRRRKPKP